MGLRNALRLVSATATASAYTMPGEAAPADLPPAVAAAFGLNTDLARVTRREAMTIPAVRRARAIVAGVIGVAPLIAVRGVDLERVPRPLLEQPDPTTTRQHYLTWVIDDLIFYGVSWSLVTVRDATGYPSGVRRLYPEDVFVDVAAGRVYVAGRPVDDADVIRFDGPDEGVLAYGARTLRTCLALDDAVRRFARLDVPLGVLRLKDGARELTAEQIDGLLDQWEHARESRTTAYLNGAVDYDTVMFDAERVQLAEARTFQGVEVARLMNLPPRYLAAPSGDSMTYSNVEAERRDLVDTSLSPYVAAVEQRLSMGDVTPRGQTVRLDLSAYLRGDTATAVSTAKTAIDAGVISADEARADIFNRPPREVAE